MMGISSTGTQGCVYLTKPWEKKLSGIPFFANFAITMSRRHYRLDFIAENTFNRVWSLRMSRPRVFLAAVACIAAVAALIFVLLAYTPLRQLMPGALHGDLRSRYIETALRVDSLENKVRLHRAYIDNIATIMRGDDTDTLAYSDGMAAIELPSDADSLLAAGEAERDFVRRYSDEERFNLSVLAPIAAEGMVFGSPLSGGATVDAVPGGIRMNPGRAAAVTAVYRGTITGVFHLAGEAPPLWCSTLTIFSVYTAVLGRCLSNPANASRPASASPIRRRGGRWCSSCGTMVRLSTPENI